MDGFEILDKLGDGAYSVVYKVKRKEDKKTYALKKVKLQSLSDKEKQNALNEVRILASVKSTFVISYKEAFIDEADKSLCIVMEYADKGDLYQKITQFKKIGCLMEEIDIWKIFIQMTKGLKALHDLKILHRDLKSANIFLFSDGSAKIGDLNVSKVAKKGLGYTQTGTPYYASPEVWRDQPYDSKSDIWSLGCVTYEMIALHPPFRAENMEALYNKVIKGQYGKISDIYSNDLSEIIKLLLKTNASERPSCGQILKHPFVKKRIEFFQVNSENEDIENMDESALLLTIRIPKNILFLTDKLPTANYGNNKKNDGIKDAIIHKQKNTFPNTNLPDIKIKNKEKKSSSNNYLNEGDLLKEKEKERLKQLSNLSNNNKETNNLNINNNSKENNKIRSINSHSLENNHIYHNNLIKKANIIQLDKIELNNLDNKRYDLSKKIQRKKQYDFQSYLKSIGLGNLYKLYSPNLDYNIKNNIKTKNYNNINKQKKSNNNSNIDYGSPKIIPNRRLNPINKRIKL